MKNAIEEHLRPLIGLRLRYGSHAVDMATFGFGEMSPRETRGEVVEIAAYRLHIQGQWRIVRDGKVLVGYADWHWPPLGSDVEYADFVERDAPRTRRDNLLDAFATHGESAHIVTGVEGAQCGDLRTAFVDGCVLETFANHATLDDGRDEFWRLLPPEQDADHFVVTSRGIEA